MFINTYSQFYSNSTSSEVSSFDLDRIINAQNNATIKSEYKSNDQYFIQFENGFYVLSDDKTIIGVKGAEYKTLQTEDMSNNSSPTTIDNQGSYICTLLYNKKLKALLVGRDNGTVMQYKHCLLYTSPSPRDGLLSRMPSSA